MNAASLFKFGHFLDAYDALDRTALKLLLAIERVFVYLQLGLELIVQLAEEIDTLGHCKRLGGHQGLRQELDGEELLLELGPGASVDDAKTDLLPVRQLRVLEDA